LTAVTLFALNLTITLIRRRRILRSQNRHETHAQMDARHR
jgi:hypothetical protein